MATETSSGVTTMRCPVIVESALSEICSITGLIFFFFEKENLYTRAHALQSILFFLFCALVSIPFFILNVIVGGAFEYVFIGLIVLYFVLRVVLIVMAVLFAKNEQFTSIPLIKDVILKLAN